MAEKREHFIKIYFTKAEMEKLLERIPENVATSVWIRRLALHEDMEALYKKYRSVKDPDLIRQITQVNIALNQLSRSLNQGSSSDSSTLIKLLSFFVSIEETLTQALRKGKA